MLARGDRRSPVLVALLALAPTLTCTLIVRCASEPSLYRAVRRDPDLYDGEVWRVITPVLVQPDPWPFVAVVFAFVTWAYWLLSRALGPWPVLVGYVAGAVPAELIGTFWSPYRGGVSVTGLGVLGIWVMLRWAQGSRWPLVLCAVLAVLWCVIQDVHGPALVGGLLVGVVVIRVWRHDGAAQLPGPASADR